jgi:hypothetical protein
MKRTEEILDEVQLILTDRGNIYGNAGENHRRISELWSGYLDTYISPEQVAMAMLLVKVARLSQTSNHDDSLRDLLGYGIIFHQIVREMRGENDGI